VETMSSISMMALFAFAAVLNASVLGAVLLWRGRHNHLIWLGLIFLCIGFLLSVYTLEHYDRVWIGGWLRVAYDVVSLALSCFLAEYVVGGLTGWRPPLWIYVSLVAYLVALALFRGSFLEWFTIGKLVLAQSFYTVLALVVCARDDDAPWKAKRWSRSWVHVAVVPVAFLSVHAAHAVRVAWSGRGALDVAPVVGIIALMGMTSYALTSARFSGWVARRPRLDKDQSRQLLGRLDRAMGDERLFARPSLDLRALADAVGATPQNLSAALNTELGKSFYEYVTFYRIDEAKRLLQAPEQSALSLEAIGAESGFKSRSSFYSAFKAATGMTPGEYRKSPTH
jgi:AraC-like DNA-binding protein